MRPNSDDTHYRMENKLGPDYIPCAKRSAVEGEKLTLIMDEVTCPACVIALVHKAVNFVAA